MYNPTICVTLFVKSNASHLYLLNFFLSYPTTDYRLVKSHIYCFYITLPFHKISGLVDIDHGAGNFGIIKLHSYR